MDIIAMFVGLFGVLFMLAYFGVGIYCLILFIKLASRGIKALDIYNNKKNIA